MECRSGEQRRLADAAATGKPAVRDRFLDCLHRFEQTSVTRISLAHDDVAAWRALVKVLARHVYESKRREYEVFVASGLEWTLVRPPRVIDGPPTGHAVFDTELHGTRVTQGDVAEAMVRALANDSHLMAAPYVSYHPDA